MCTNSVKDLIAILKDSLEQSSQVCPPDQYQLRLNDLSRITAKLLLLYLGEDFVNDEDE